MTDRKRVFSGMQPTGAAHLGNLIGAFSNWVGMQDEYDTIYCVVDLHAMSAPYDPVDLSESRLRLAKMIIAAGVDPKRSLLYYQSEVPQDKITDDRDNHCEDKHGKDIPALHFQRRVFRRYQEISYRTRKRDV